MIKVLTIILFFLNVILLTVQSAMIYTQWSSYVSLSCTLLSSMTFRKHWAFHVYGMSFQYLSIIFNMVTGFNPLNIFVVVMQVFLLNSYIILVTRSVSVVGVVTV